MSSVVAFSSKKAVFEWCDDLSFVRRYCRVPMSQLRSTGKRGVFGYHDRKQNKNLTVSVSQHHGANGLYYTGKKQ